jgi:hypothetical protein
LKNAVVRKALVKLQLKKAAWFGQTLAPLKITQIFCTMTIGKML